MKNKRDNSKRRTTQKRETPAKPVIAARSVPHFGASFLQGKMKMVLVLYK